MDLFSNMSDDQIALLGCAGAFCVASLLMIVSYYAGQRNQRDSEAGQQVLLTRQTDAESLNKAA